MIFPQRGLTVNHAALSASPWTRPRAGIWGQQDPGRVSRPLISGSALSGDTDHGVTAPRCPSHPGHPQGLPGAGGAALGPGAQLCSRAQSRTDQPGIFNIPSVTASHPLAVCYLCPVHLCRVPTAATPDKCCDLVLGMSPGRCHQVLVTSHALRYQGRGQKGTQRDRKGQTPSALSPPTEHLTSSCLAWRGHSLCTENVFKYGIYFISLGTIITSGVKHRSNIILYGENPELREEEGRDNPGRGLSHECPGCL